MTDQLTVQAHAKVNLWLRVFGRDSKGYHAIETLYQLISIADDDIQHAGQASYVRGILDRR